MSICKSFVVKSIVPLAFSFMVRPICLQNTILKMIYVSADIYTNYLQGGQTILVEEQIFGQMLLVVVIYSVQLDHIVQLPPANLIAVVYTKFSPIIGHIATMYNVLLVANLYCFSNHVLTR